MKRSIAAEALCTKFGWPGTELQDQQGSEGQEYGGIYKSSDGGSSWNESIR